jgi:hypothetical protein
MSRWRLFGGRGLASLGEKLAETIGHLESYELLARLEPDDRTSMLHLLNCRDCRRRSRRELAERIEERLATTGAEAEVPRGASESLMRHLAEIAAARVVADRLLALPRVERKAAIDADSEGYGQPMLGLVLVASARSLVGDPAGAQEQAELSLEILSREPEASRREWLALRLEALGILIVAHVELDELEEGGGELSASLASAEEESAQCRPAWHRSGRLCEAALGAGAPRRGGGPLRPRRGIVCERARAAGRGSLPAAGRRPAARVGRPATGSLGAGVGLVAAGQQAGTGAGGARGVAARLLLCSPGAVSRGEQLHRRGAATVPAGAGSR